MIKIEFVQKCIPVKNVSFFTQFGKDPRPQTRTAPQFLVPVGLPGAARRAADVEESLQAPQPGRDWRAAA